MLRRAPAVVLVAALLLAGVAAAASHGANSSTVVTASVPSATTLITTGCQPATTDVTEFGIVLPGTAARTGSDCVVTFGSSNDSASLRLAQADGTGTAMQRAEQAAMNSGSATVIGTLAALDRTTGWAGLNGGGILKTTDAGATWVPQASGVTDNLRGTLVRSSSEVFMVGYNGRMLRTLDGGSTWTPIATGTTRELDDIIEVDASTLLAVGGDTDTPVILRSTDAGASWSDVTPGGVAADLTEASMANATRGWAVGRDGVILRTDDAGQAWTVQTACTGQDLRGVAAISATVAVAVGHVGWICRTTDGGATWLPVTSGTSANLWEVDRAPDGSLWAVSRGATSQVLRSLDDGVSWHPVANETVNLEDVVAFDRESAWWSGWSGLLGRIPSGSLPDYDDAGGVDWSGSSSMFGVCLSSTTTASAVWDDAAGCPMSDGAHWRAVPATTSLPDARVATTAPMVSNAQAAFRFGFRPSNAQAAGRYVASIAFEVVAPST